MKSLAQLVEATEEEAKKEEEIEVKNDFVSNLLAGEGPASACPAKIEALVERIRGDVEENPVQKIVV